MVLSDDAAAISCPSGENFTSSISIVCAPVKEMIGEARLLVLLMLLTRPFDLDPSLDIATCIDLSFSSCFARFTRL